MAHLRLSFVASFIFINSFCSSLFSLVLLCFFVFFYFLILIGLGLCCNRKSKANEKRPHLGLFLRRYYTARSTFPARRQRVQILMVLLVPLIFARSFRIFGIQLRLVLILEWLTRWPVCRSLPHISQRRANSYTSNKGS